MATVQSRAWGTLVAATLGGVLLSLAPLQQSQGGTTPCTSMGGPFCGGGDCPAFQTCVNAQGNCTCVPTGCCQVNSTLCLGFVDQGSCDAKGGQFHLNGTCGNECQPLVPDGGSCDDPADCDSGNCVDDVCCDEPSCPPGESCDNRENAGTCSLDPTAPAPAISRSGTLVALGIMIAIGGFAVLRRRRGAS